MWEENSATTENGQLRRKTRLNEELRSCEAKGPRRITEQDQRHRRKATDGLQERLNFLHKGTGVRRGPSEEAQPPERFVLPSFSAHVKSTLHAEEEDFPWPRQRQRQTRLFLEPPTNLRLHKQQLAHPCRTMLSHVSAKDQANMLMQRRYKPRQMFDMHLCCHKHCPPNRAVLQYRRIGKGCYAFVRLHSRP